MSCLNPIFAVSIMKNHDDKHVLKFLNRGDIENIRDRKFVYGSDNVFLLPCGRCDSCRESYAKDWAVRCSLESRLHRFNYFITLTYDNNHLAYFSKKDFSQKFLKSLGYLLTQESVRPKFFACIELGFLTNRPHFHAILFLDNELELKDPVKKGDFYHYHSKEIEQCWPFGLHDITPFEHDCAAYVGKYATKQGRCFMSRNLAKDYYLKHRDEIIKDDFKIYVDFNSKNYIDIPKSFVRWFCEDHVSEVDDLKLSRSQLQKLLVIQDIHAKGMRSESDFIADSILAYYRHLQHRKERSDL